VEVLVTDHLADISDWQVVRDGGKVHSKDTIVCNGVGVGNNRISCITGLHINNHVATKRASNCCTRRIVLKLDVERPMITIVVEWMANCLDQMDNSNVVLEVRHLIVI
jgi:hypothetical protein